MKNDYEGNYKVTRQTDTAKKQIEQIEASLEAIHKSLERDKQNIDELDRADISVMGRFIELLKEAERFYQSLQSKKGA